MENQLAEANIKPLSLVDMSCAFVILGLGISLSLLVFLIELIYKRINDHYFTGNVEATPVRPSKTKQSRVIPTKATDPKQGQKKTIRSLRNKVPLVEGRNIRPTEATISTKQSQVNKANTTQITDVKKRVTILVKTSPKATAIATVNIKKGATISAARAHLVKGQSVPATRMNTKQDQTLRATEYSKIKKSYDPSTLNEIVELGE